MAPAVIATEECQPCLGTAVTHVSGLYTGRIELKTTLNDEGA